MFALPKMAVCKRSVWWPGRESSWVIECLLGVSWGLPFGTKLLQWAEEPCWRNPEKLEHWGSIAVTGPKRKEQRQWDASASRHKRWKVGTENWRRKQLGKWMVVDSCWGGMEQLRLPGKWQAALEPHGAFSGLVCLPERQSGSQRAQMRGK